MKKALCVTVLVALVGLTACAPNEPAPVEEPQPQAETQPEDQPVSTEDFESGEAKGGVHEGVEAAEENGD